MKRVEYFDGSNSRLTREFLDLRAGDGTWDARVVEWYLLCGLLFELLL